jgi:hypothetical protein
MKISIQSNNSPIYKNHQTLSNLINTAEDIYNNSLTLFHPDENLLNIIQLQHNLLTQPLNNNYSNLYTTSKKHSQIISNSLNYNQTIKQNSFIFNHILN